MDHAEGEKLSGARKSGTADGGTLEKPAGFGQGPKGQALGSVNLSGKRTDRLRYASKGVL